MYALIESGEKQYRVAPGNVLDVELIAAGDRGEEVQFDRGLMVAGDKGVRVGSPIVDDAVVKASVVGHMREPKIRVFKMKQRKHYRRNHGHRQDLLRVKIEGIEA